MRTVRTAERVVPTAAFIAVLASCGTGSGQPSAQSSPTATPSAVIAPISAPTESSITATGGPASACRSGDVGMSFGEDPNGGATGESSMAIRFTNNGSGPCVLNGRPSVEFLDASGSPVGLREDERFGGMYFHAHATSTIRLAPGAGADVEIAKYRCDLGYKTTATQIRLALPGERTTTTYVANADDMNGAVALHSCLGGHDDPGQTYAISGYTLFECHLVGNATGGGWCDGELGRQPAQTVDESTRAAQKEELARRHNSGTTGRDR